MAIAAAVVIGFALPTMVAAQGPSTPPGMSTKTTSAPAGHRQPRTKDAPVDNPSISEEDAKKMDEELNRRLKGICRGC